MHQHSISSRLFDLFIITVIALYAIICILPFIHIIAGSFTTSAELLRKGFVLIPTEYSLDAYRYIFSTSTLIRSLGVTIYLTVAGTILNVIFTALLAYPLARKDVGGRKAVLKLVLFTMLFNGGMIPSFLLVKQLGLLNTLWSLMLPGLIGAFILIILKTFFQQLPESIEESAKIDGANDLQILYKIVLPLSMPAIATISLFYAVAHWNTFMQAVLYINNSELWPIQVLLRQIILMSSGNVGDSSMMDEGTVPPAQTVKMAVIVVATVPILLVYPFLQKHFTKGVMLGSVKG
ncbi:MAG: YtcP3 [Paenibacillus sp.]|jgi:putative aldouronate transport system permease protein|nr:YtcP3 [Paenibacillus sp.]